MKIISWNVNGIRAVERKGQLDVLIETEAPDILMLQETKASPDQLSKNLTEHPDYEQFYHSADKKGYSGTSIWVARIHSKAATYTTGMKNFKGAKYKAILKIRVTKFIVSLIGLILEFPILDS